MAKSLDALEYLADPASHPAQGVTVLFGDESFLKRQALAMLRGEVLAGDDAEFSLSTFSGNAELSAVFDELGTIALFGGGRRLVVVDEADDFVSRYRAELERYVEHPKTGGVLVLDVKSWPSNTRLFKAVAKSGLQMECKFPAEARLLKWLATRAKQAYQAKLEPAAAEALIEILEPELGLFDQELAKLASLVGPQGTITVENVRDAVGGWRTRTTWEMLDAAAGGRAASALLELDRLLASGEAPIAILAQISSTLRRFAAATRCIQQAEGRGHRLTLRQALEQAGFKTFTLAKAEGQLRHMGRVRGGQLYRRLLEADLALKGSSSSPAKARYVLEKLLVWLAAPSGSPAKSAR